MTVTLNHTIVHVQDKMASARFYSEILGLPDAEPYGHFMVLSLRNGVSLDFLEVRPDISSQHYAFLVSEEEFDEIIERIRQRKLGYWADPWHHVPGKINTNDGGRGVYWSDPDGHNLEILTRPYGG
ncbi:VOC family protein [Arthrobacter sp. ISL-48]|uniref:VOC family protein n=1 Tax=Arthrobacter sp. ISL-48 TaxID=2819110 RepID=UPI001BEA85C4|nr:VOC family protein [Arthrobacter sp. ISL-48]MBT2533357.1 VOC family protein [Arthrobacter sp. ISL-48]